MIFVITNKCVIHNECSGKKFLLTVEKSLWFQYSCAKFFAMVLNWMFEVPSYIVPEIRRK